MDKIFFLRHASANAIRPVEGAGASSMLLTRSFPPLWDAGAMEFTLAFCARVADEIPCHELDFFPDEKIVDFLRCGT